MTFLNYETNRTFEIANYNFGESHDEHEHQVIEWNLDKIFSPVVSFFGFDKIKSVPDHAEVMYFGENHMDTVFIFISLAAFSYYGLKHFFHNKIPFIIGTFKSLLNRIGRKRSKTVSKVTHDKPYVIESSYYVAPTQTTQVGWGWDDHDVVDDDGWNHVSSVEKQLSIEGEEEEQPAYINTRNNNNNKDYNYKKRLRESFEMYLRAREKYENQDFQNQQESRRRLKMPNRKLVDSSKFVKKFIKY